jgi:hypothetical protein
VQLSPGLLRAIVAWFAPCNCRPAPCRNCGNSFCGGCCDASVALPHYGLPDAQRCCKPCFDAVAAGKFRTKAGGESDVGAAKAKAAEGPKAAAEEPKAAADEPKVVEEPRAAEAPRERIVKNCTCGLPMCICDEDAPEEPAREAGKGKPAAAPAAAAAAAAPKETAKVE